MVNMWEKSPAKSTVLNLRNAKKRYRRKNPQLLKIKKYFGPKNAENI